MLSSDRHGEVNLPLAEAVFALVIAKLRLLPDLLRYRRSDVSLVRLITPLRNPTPDAELASCLEFTKRLFPLVSEHLASVSTQRQ